MEKEKEWDSTKDKKKSKKTPVQILTVDDLLTSVDKVSKALELPAVNLCRSGYSAWTVSTGSLILDLILGGGYPISRWSTIFGPEGAGKSTLSYHFIKNCLDLEVPVLHFDYESGSDPIYLKAVGVDTSNPLYRYFHPSSGEQVFRVIHRILSNMPTKPLAPAKSSKGKKKDSEKLRPSIAFVIDSIAAMLPEVIEEDDHSHPMAVVSKMFSANIPLIKSPLAEKRGILLAVNQIRKAIEKWGSFDTEPGGNAIRHYPDLKLKISKSNSLGEQGVLESKEGRYIYVTAKTTKNKSFCPFLESSFRIKLGYGIDEVYDTYQYLKETGQLWDEDGKYEIKLPKYAGMFFEWKDLAKIFLSNQDIRETCREQLNSDEAFSLYFAAQADK